MDSLPIPFPSSFSFHQSSHADSICPLTRAQPTAMASSPSCESQARTVCLTCGDKGNEGLLIYCIKCQYSAAHLYCLQDFSSNDDQIGWKCWDCAPVNKIEPFRKSERINMRINRANEVRMNLETKLYSRSSHKARKFILTGHGMGETTQPVMEIENASDGIDANIGVTDCDNKSRLKDARNPQEKYDIFQAKFSPLTSNIHDIGFPSPKRLKVGMTESAQLEGDSSISIDRMNIIQSFSELPRNQEFRKRRRRRLIIDDNSSSEKEDPINIEESSLDSQEYFCPLNTSYIQLSAESQSQLFAESLLNPIWRGCFSITTEKNEINLGMLGHLSSKACSKVSDKAIVLPPVLVVEVLSKHSVWPRSFQSSPPTNASIDLYFFPEYQRDEKVFDGLLDNIIEDDLALKVMMKDLELLIFSSLQLPLEHWRFQMKYYLWGVFQQIHTSLPSLPVIPPINSSSHEIVLPFKLTNQSGKTTETHRKAKPDRIPHIPDCCSP